MGFSVQMYYYGRILMENRRQERQRVARDQEEPGDVRDFRTQLVSEHGERARDFVWWSMGALLILSLDAYVSVQLSGFDNPNPPTPDLDRDWNDTGDGGGLALKLNFGF